jgi:mannose-1-phosphate guanylyltransferase
MPPPSNVVGAVLAAGLGTRLRPLTEARPKPLVPIAGAHLIDFALAALARAGVREVGVNAWHLGAQVEAAMAERPGPITVVREAELEGTGGGLRGIARALGHPTVRRSMVCLNGDALLDFDLAPVLAAQASRAPVATMVVKAVPADSPFARVGVDPDGVVHRIAEIRGPGAGRADLRPAAYVGVQVVAPAILDAIPARGECDVLRTAHRALMAAGERVDAFFVPADTPWLDVGTPDRYLEANFAALTGWVRTPRPLPPAAGDGVRVDPNARVSPDARLVGPCMIAAGAQVGAGATVGPHVVVDRDAEIAPGAHVERSVVWPGVRVEGRFEGAVLWRS